MPCLLYAGVRTGRTWIGPGASTSPSRSGRSQTELAHDRVQLRSGLLPEPLDAQPQLRQHGTLVGADRAGEHGSIPSVRAEHAQLDVLLLGVDQPVLRHAGPLVLGELLHPV